MHRSNGLRRERPVSCAPDREVLHREVAGHAAGSGDQGSDRRLGSKQGQRPRLVFDQRGARGSERHLDEEGLASARGVDHDLAVDSARTEKDREAVEPLAHLRVGCARCHREHDLA